MKTKMLMIMFVLMLVLTGCSSNSEEGASYFGSWKATEKIYYAPVAAMSAEEYEDTFLGEIAAYAETSASFRESPINNPNYSEEMISEEAFYENYRVNLKDLEIEDKEVKVVQIQNWTEPGSVFLIKDQDTLIALWDGVFFELERQ